MEKFINGKNSLILKGARRSGKKKHGLGYTPPENEETIVYPKKYPLPRFVAEQEPGYKTKANKHSKPNKTTNDIFCCTHCN